MKLSEIHIVLNEVRRNRGLSQQDIAGALSVEQATVSMYENGKRGIPLEILDAWLQILGIDVKITPKEFEPINDEEDLEEDLQKFMDLKKRRNYLIAELRAMMAEKIMQVPEFSQVHEETGENRFWPYSFRGQEFVGLVETRYDHPEQKYLAVEYTLDEVNVYKFLPAGETGEELDDREWLNISRLYFSEDDFLTFGELWNEESMERRKMTVLRKSTNHPDGVEIVDPEGFPIRALAEMMGNFNRLDRSIKTLETDGKYIRMGDELDAIRGQMADIVIRNRRSNGTANPDFVFWADQDFHATDVPLYEPCRRWSWLEEGVEWVEDFQELQEIVIETDGSFHYDFPVLRNEKGERVIGLCGEEKKPAVFKGNPHKPSLIYRAAVKIEDLSDDELREYKDILAATKELDDLKKQQ